MDREDARRPTCGSWPRPNCAAAAAPRRPGPRDVSDRLPLVAQALIAVGAVDVATADEIQADSILPWPRGSPARAARHRGGWRGL